MAVYYSLGEGFYTRACRDRTRKNGFSLKEGMFRVDERKNFYAVKVVSHWHWLSRKTVAAISSGVFKARLDGVI